MYENQMMMMSVVCWWQSEIERLQSELDKASHQLPTCQTVNADSGNSADRLTHEETASSTHTECQQLIDTLKCQLQHVSLKQQTTHTQLEAIKQVYIIILTVL